MKPAAGILLLGTLFLTALAGSTAVADCPEEPPLLNYTGAGSVTCPCFIAGERAGVILDAPADHYPIEILRVGIGWGSAFGGAPQQIEQAIRIYPAGLPNPGTPLFSLDGPVLTDGVINEFDLEPFGPITVAGGPFTVALEFLNESSGDPFAPSVVHDGNGCTPNKNVVYAIPGGWFSSCTLGVTGDWIFYVIYRQTDCAATGVPGQEFIANNAPSTLFAPQPNPFGARTQVEFFLAREGQADVSVYDPRGRRVAPLASGIFPAGRRHLEWDGRRTDGSRVAPGVYFVVMETAGTRSTRRLVFAP